MNRGSKDLDLSVNELPPDMQRQAVACLDAAEARGGGWLPDLNSYVPALVLSTADFELLLLDGRTVVNLRRTNGKWWFSSRSPTPEEKQFREAAMELAVSP